ncbi:hypothetical protein TNCV_5091361 [Trichonephila clavipes]|nr:hypothetical protein TNCV_5091361 [Trichonephila clavipes]
MTCYNIEWRCRLGNYDSYLKQVVDPTLCPFSKKTCFHVIKKNCTQQTERRLSSMSRTCSIGFKSAERAGHFIQSIVPRSTRALCTLDLLFTNRALEPMTPRYGQTYE